MTITLSLAMVATLTLPPVGAGGTLDSSTEGRGTTTRVSVSGTGEQGNSLAFDGATNGDGRYVSFSSYASNLVSGDTNEDADVFVRDRAAGTTTRVSVASDGVQGNGWSVEPVLSTDGRFVAFTSRASNLVPGDTNDEPDVFVHDRRTGTTRIVSVSTDGLQADNGGASGARISADGRFVAFVSWASTLVPDDTNGAADVFVRDLRRGVTSRVSVSSLGVQGNQLSQESAISADGRFVAFSSDAANLVPGDTNESPDVFVHDRRTGVTSRVSLTDDEAEAVGPAPELGSRSPAISADGRYVAFTSFALNLVPGDTNGFPDVFVRDRRAGTTRLVSVSSGGIQADAAGRGPSISADGQYVAFSSPATNLVRGDTNQDLDMFLHDRRTHRTIRVSVSTAGVQGNGSVLPGQVSGDGRHVVFTSAASNLVPADSNEAQDVFVWDPHGTRS
ncbi:PD40 domain-containing protein [Plantactinospora mayteni]|uniref:Calcium-binding protein n=1 Tax=Plantactinospora mayteni TaxID=566021 RepID=A0ABQ4F0F6_9ACTN|nr:PD40 domain-containing protein [Plantactinospora mayteni]GIH00387.1 hypothetical protein Pma05_69590 [Plantactinospora mayteni]